MFALTRYRLHQAIPSTKHSYADWIVRFGAQVHIAKLQEIEGSFLGRPLLSVRRNRDSQGFSELGIDLLQVHGIFTGAKAVVETLSQCGLSPVAAWPTHDR